MNNSYTHYKGLLKLCCSKEENLEKPVEAGDGSTYRKCRKCGCRHFSMTADPGIFGVRHIIDKLTKEQLDDLVDSIISQKREHMAKIISRCVSS